METVEKQLAETDSFRSQKHPNLSVNKTLAVARLEAHRRKRLFRAQQIQRYMLAQHMKQAADFQAAHGEDDRA